MSLSATSELCFRSARELATLIHAQQISARDVMQAHLDRIARINPRVNAIVSKLPDEACLALADEADRRLARGDGVGALHGLPIAFKDNQPAVGFPWTRGSRIFAHDMPSEDSVFVERLRAAGAIPIGKTNIPEFAMGSHTYNALFGRDAESLRPHARAPAARAAARPLRWPRGCCPSPTATTWAARFAIRPTSTTSWRFARPSAWSRPHRIRFRDWAST